MTEKDPTRRFQTAEELIDALEGRQPMVMLPAGSARVAPPTAPLPAAEREHWPVIRRGGPRDRRARQRGGRGAGLALLGLVAASGTAAGWYFVSRPGAGPAPEPPTASAPAPADTTSRVEPSAPRSSTGTSPVPVAPPPADSVRPAGGPPGFVLVRGAFPQGTLVTFDGMLASSAVTELPSGPRAVGISAPGHQFFTDTIIVLAGDTLEYQPELTRLGSTPGPRRSAPVRDTAPPPAAAAAPALVPTCEAPGPAYNLGNICYDDRPRPAVEDPFVPRPAGAQPAPRESVLWVYVSADGRALEILPRIPSDDAVFEQAARQFAMSIPWRPAAKAGEPVPGWTQWGFPVRAP
jgi:hypothetical protein